MFNFSYRKAFISFQLYAFQPTQINQLLLSSGQLSFLPLSTILQLKTYGQRIPYVQKDQNFFYNVSRIVYTSLLPITQG